MRPPPALPQPLPRPAPPPHTDAQHGRRWRRGLSRTALAVALRPPPAWCSLSLSLALICPMLVSLTIN